MNEKNDETIEQTIIKSMNTYIFKFIDLNDDDNITIIQIFKTCFVCALFDAISKIAFDCYDVKCIYINDVSRVCVNV